MLFYVVITLASQNHYVFPGNLAEPRRMQFSVVLAFAGITSPLPTRKATEFQFSRGGTLDIQCCYLSPHLRGSTASEINRLRVIAHYVNYTTVSPLTCLCCLQLIKRCDHEMCLQSCRVFWSPFAATWGAVGLPSRSWQLSWPSLLLRRSTAPHLHKLELLAQSHPRPL